MMEEIVECTICLREDSKHIELYGKISQEEYDAMRDEAMIKKTGFRNVFITFDTRMFVDDGKLTASITTICNRCKDERVYEGALIEVK